MYQYRGEIERTVANKGRDEAWQYTRSLYANGFINLNEWNTLSEYSKDVKCEGVI